jgi:hypothetical protein
MRMCLRLWRGVSPIGKGKSLGRKVGNPFRRGIWHVDAGNEVNEGIRVVAMVLIAKMLRFAVRQPRKTIQEMQTYTWDAKAAQRREEKPLKVHDHGPDASRYFAKNEAPYWRLGGDCLQAKRRRGSLRRDDQCHRPIFSNTIQQSVAGITAIGVATPYSR